MNWTEHLTCDGCGGLGFPERGEKGNSTKKNSKHVPLDFHVVAVAIADIKYLCSSRY